MVLGFPAEVRLELARRLVESVAWPATPNAAIAERIRRSEDVATGRTPRLTKEQLRAALFMRALFQQEFPKDIRKFEQDYRAISDGLADRFRRDIDEALEAINLSPRAPGISFNQAPRW